MKPLLLTINISRYKKRLPVVILITAALFSCSKKEKQEAASPDWKELESFHKQMAKVYHPLKDSGNLTPAKEGIAQLADEAEKWSQAALPEKVNTPEMKEQLQNLKINSRTLANEVAGAASDEVIREGIIKLHDQFHEIMEAWMGKNENHPNDEQDH